MSKRTKGKHAFVPSHVAVELRAHELAANYVPDMFDALFSPSEEENIGWALHRDDDDEPPRTESAWAGWLAREIYDQGLVDDVDDDEW